MSNEIALRESGNREVVPYKTEGRNIIKRVFARYLVLISLLYDNSISQQQNCGAIDMERGEGCWWRAVAESPLVTRSLLFSRWAFKEHHGVQLYDGFQQVSPGLELTPLPTAGSTPLFELIADAVPHSWSAERQIASAHDVEIAQNWLLVLTDGWAESMPSGDWK